MWLAFGWGLSEVPKGCNTQDMLDFLFLYNFSKMLCRRKKGRHKNLQFYQRRERFHMFSCPVFLDLLMIWKSVNCFPSFSFLPCPFSSLHLAGMCFVLSLSHSVEIGILIYLGRSVPTLLWLGLGMGTKSLIGLPTVDKGLRLAKVRWLYVPAHKCWDAVI